MPLKLTLPSDIEQRLEDVGVVIAAASPEVDFAYVFGSVGLGRQTSRSDVDLAIHLSEGADAYAVRLDVARSVAKHLATDAVDVIVLNSAPIALAGRVATTRRVVLDRRPFIRHRYESITARMFQDFRIREHRLLTRRFARGG